MTNSKSSWLSLPVDIKYEVLPAEHGLPAQVDVLAVTVKTSRRGRKIQLLHLLDEAEVMQLEDEIMEDL